MAGFIGEFPCTVDAKGRFMLPAGLKKQIPAKEQKNLVIHRGMEKQLTIYTRKEWDKITEEIYALNQYVKKNREFIRKFNRGATPIELDATNRILIPKSLMEYAGIEKDIVLFTYGNRIEIWSQAEFDRMMASDKDDDMAQLAEDVMGDKNDDELS